jgi:hypothetical protein
LVTSTETRSPPARVVKFGLLQLSVPASIVQLSVVEVAPM